jgi:hypothetical protein
LYGAEPAAGASVLTSTTSGPTQVIEHVFDQSGADALAAAGCRCCRPEDLSRCRPTVLDDGKSDDRVTLHDYPWAVSDDVVADLLDDLRN